MRRETEREREREPRKQPRPEAGRALAERFTAPVKASADAAQDD